MPPKVEHSIRADAGSFVRQKATPAGAYREQLPPGNQLPVGLDSRE